MLQYDRQITISAGGGHNAIRWPLQTLYWSELVERLQVPVRGTETLNAYLKLPKRQRDDLKDVGGFVGGIVHNGGRRRVNSIDGRDVLTLDLDHIPAGGTDDVLRRVDSLSWVLHLLNAQALPGSTAPPGSAAIRPNGNGRRV